MQGKDRQKGSLYSYNRIQSWGWLTLVGWVLGSFREKMLGERVRGTVEWWREVHSLAEKLVCVKYIAQRHEQQRSMQERRGSLAWLLCRAGSQDDRGATCPWEQCLGMVPPTRVKMYDVRHTSYLFLSWSTSTSGRVRHSVCPCSVDKQAGREFKWLV